jgi:hypothetical protein
MAEQKSVIEKRENAVKSIAKVKTNVPFGILSATKKVTTPLQEIADALKAIALEQKANTSALIALTEAIRIKVTA